MLRRNTYLRDAWNWLDFVVVVTAIISWIVGGQKLGTLRVFRVAWHGIVACTC